MTSAPLTIGSEQVLPRLADYVRHFAAHTPDAVAIVSGSRRLTYAELAGEVEAWSRALLAARISKGDRVAMLCSPSAEFWIAFLAASQVGAIWVGLNPKYTQREIDYVVADARPRLLLSLSSHQGKPLSESVTELTSVFPELRVVSIDGELPNARTLDDWLARGERTEPGALERRLDSVDTMDPALIVYTSGSTGKPKGAVLSHYGLTFGAVMQTLHFRVDNPSLVVSFPINHVASVADTCATTLVKGGKIVFMEQFDAGGVLRATARERCTMIGGVPTMLQMMLAAEEYGSVDLDSVELVLWGGAAMPVEIIEQLQRTGKRLITAYGMTETACHVTYTAADADIDELANTVGQPDPRCACRVATDDASPSTPQHPGELQVKGDFLMLGYWERPKATRDAFTPDGWLRTGDLAYEREDGNLCLVGRMSDMFKSGGYNVYPREIETVLESHPSVSLAAVVAVPDDLYQEVGHAFVIPEGGATLEHSVLDAWCRERLANYKVPKRIFVEAELPLLPVGKVDKQALKRRSTS